MVTQAGSAKSQGTEHLQNITSSLDDKYVFWLMLVVPTGLFRAQFLADDALNLKLLCQLIETCQNWEMYDFLIEAFEDIEIPKDPNELLNALA